MRFLKIRQPNIVTVAKFMTTLLALALIAWIICCIKVWIGVSRGSVAFRHRIEAMTPAQADKVSLDLMAAMINASQTNWNVVIVPRTNQ